MSKFAIGDKVYVHGGDGITKEIKSIDENQNTAECEWKDPKSKEIKRAIFNLSDLRLKKELNMNQSILDLL